MVSLSYDRMARQLNCLNNLPDDLQKNFVSLPSGVPHRVGEIHHDIDSDQLGECLQVLLSASRRMKSKEKIEKVGESVWD